MDEIVVYFIRIFEFITVDRFVAVGKTGADMLAEGMVVVMGKVAKGIVGKV